MNQETTRLTALLEGVVEATPDSEAIVDEVERLHYAVIEARVENLGDEASEPQAGARRPRHGPGCVMKKSLIVRTAQ